jgi:hypothetical protein
MKKSQCDELENTLALMTNRLETDHQFWTQFEELMRPCKSHEEARGDKETTGNELQSVENQRSSLQRDVDMSIDKFEKISEDILEQL